MATSTLFLTAFFLVLGPVASFREKGEAFQLAADSATATATVDEVDESSDELDATTGLPQCCSKPHCCSQAGKGRERKMQQCTNALPTQVHPACFPAHHHHPVDHRGGGGGFIPAAPMGQGWQPRATPCCDGPTVWSAAGGLARKIRMSGGLQQFFYELAGPDGHIDQWEWQTRVGGGHGAVAIFQMFATQEGATWFEDNPNTIDGNDFQRVVSQVPRSDLFAVYVTTRVVAEKLFNKVNRGDDDSPRAKVSIHEWNGAFRKFGGRDGSISLNEFARKMGFHMSDVAPMFQFIEDALDSGVFAGFDDAQIGYSEWAKFGDYLSEHSEGHGWNSGVSKPQFVSMISKAAASFFMRKPLWSPRW